MFIHYVGPFNRIDRFRQDLHAPPNNIHILYARNSTSYPPFIPGHDPFGPLIPPSLPPPLFSLAPTLVEVPTSLLSQSPVSLSLSTTLHTQS